jgi:hypothetical protein
VGRRAAHDRWVVLQLSELSVAGEAKHAANGAIRVAVEPIGQKGH